MTFSKGEQVVSLTTGAKYTVINFQLDIDRVWVRSELGVHLIAEADNLKKWKPEPKFKVGDKVQNGNYDILTIHSVIEHVGEFFYTALSKNNMISFLRENAITAAKEKLPFPRVGAWVIRLDHEDVCHRKITGIAGDTAEYAVFGSDFVSLGRKYFAPISELTEVENPFEN